MKKAYMTPAIQVEKIMIEKSILTLSNPSAAIDVNEPPVAASELESRGGLWDDDDE